MSFVVRQALRTIAGYDQNVGVESRQLSLGDG